MHVIILAAGRGTRLGGDLPKPLSPIAPGRTLLGNQVEILSNLVGRDRIILVLGHRADEIIAAHPDLMYVYNERYAQTNTAKSLLGALNKIDDDALWTNADLYFEEPAAKRLLDAADQGTRLLVDRSQVGDEEIKYTTHDDGSVAQLSKAVQSPLGESLGMQIITKKDRLALVEQLELVSDQDYFEKALENCTLAGAIRAMPIALEGEYCREVDFPEDLKAVQEHLAQGATS